MRDSSSFEKIRIPGNVPIFCIKEKNVDDWIRLDELSSGMQKVLLILTDFFSLPKGSIYMIDEYENSLGVGAIDFFPQVLEFEDYDAQIIITSHHPYLIKRIPIDNWFIVHRKGSNLQFSFGEELNQKFGLSTQDKYIQLINDPFYSEGIE